ncbi:hypothetical protein J7I98_19110 [Streptomyces sp. ISL-98]|uniref:hypothetical protein n=1 Tax=Streptomyces sp. ISL-98 TaxID=2819192 RepID=UPI001BE6CF04|nr:hypothetical protein [Streptomyces sp. ISL-98]MBT2507955.1 hypothetical protein [Streptomyces sp. ISL-98]
MSRDDDELMRFAEQEARRRAEEEHAKFQAEQAAYSQRLQDEAEARRRAENP